MKQISSEQKEVIPGGTCFFGADPGFQERGFEKRRCVNSGGGGGGPPLANFELSSPRKRDFRPSEAKPTCFIISSVKIPFFFYENMKKLP